MSSRYRWPRLDTLWKRQATVEVRASSERASSASLDSRENAPRSLDRRLYSPQIFMIALSGIIGITIFATMGQFIHTAGPAGLLTAIVYVGVTAICVMEGLGELVVQWPVSNAMVHYVRTFVDNELGIAIGIVYWYTWSSVISAMVVAAANLSQYWGFSATGYVIVFYIVCPIGVIIINWFGVFWYGFVECIGGFLKLLFVLMGALFLIAEGAIHSGSQYINQGYQSDPHVAPGRFAAVLLIIPFLTYGFLGVEIVSVTGFEARKPRKDLKFSAKWIASTITFLFLLCGIGEILNFSWNDLRLPRLETRAGFNISSPSQPANPERNFSVLVMATNNAGFPRLASFFNGCLVFVCLSAANTALYVASRVLYGLVNDTDSPPWLSWLTKLNHNRVPMWALVISAASWCWLPFLQLKKAYSIESFFSVIITIGSVGAVIVWASQCLAYIRYYHWMGFHKQQIQRLRQQEPMRWKKYDRWSGKKTDRYRSILSDFQPVPAYVGLLFSTLIVLVFSSATLWSGPASAKKFFVAYGGLLLCIVIWAAAKVINRNPSLYKHLDHDSRMLRIIIEEFEARLFLRDPEESSLSQPTRVNTIDLLEVDSAARLSATPHDGNGRGHVREELDSTGAHLNTTIPGIVDVSRSSIDIDPTHH